MYNIVKKEKVMKYEITKHIIFHLGHCLKDDKSKCHNMHGHEYVLFCTIRGELQEEGFETGEVMHFGKLKEIMMEEVHDYFDHKFVFQVDDPDALKFQKLTHRGMMALSFAPTAEKLAELCYRRIEGMLPVTVKLVECVLKETSTCSAKCYE